MIDTFLLPAKYKMTEPIYAQNSFDKKISKATTVDSSNSIFRSNNRAYNEENSEGFTYNAANQENMSPVLMFDLVYTKSDDFNGDSVYAIDAIRTQLQQTLRENERITLENMELRSDNVRLRNGNKMQTEAQSQNITVSQELQRSPVNTSRRYST